MTPVRFFLAAGLLFGLAFLVATPPFQAADETAHFYRAYAVSEGILGAERGAAGLGAELPASVEEIGAGLKGDLPFHPERKIRPEQTLRAFQIPLEQDRRRFVDYRTAALVTPVSYLPQAAGIALARWLGAPALGLLYAARLANLLVGTALIALALRRLPSYPWLIALIALTPMAVFLRASASADTLNMGAAFLLVATVAKLAWGEAEPDRRDFFILTACSVALCLSKPVYVPLTLLPLLAPFRRKLVPYGIATAAAICLAMWTAGSVDITIRPDAPVDRQRQIADTLEDPVRFARILGEDYLFMGRRYVAQIVGQLGWLDVNLPKPLLWGYTLLLGLVAFLDTRREVAVAVWQRIFLIGIALATMALVGAAQYAIWTPYGADYVEGIQGRYFLPLAPAAVWILHLRRSPAGFLGRVLPWLSALSLGVALATLLQRYYGIW